MSQKYKNEKPLTASSFLVRSNGAIERIGPESEDKNQIATWGGNTNGGLESTNLEDLLANWNPNPEYICLLGDKEPKKRPYKEALREGDLWWNTEEKHLYVYDQSEWVSTTTGPSGVLLIAGQWDDEAGQIQLTFKDGLLKNVVVGSATT
jgi:hypothetical protein